MTETEKRLGLLLRQLENGRIIDFVGRINTFNDDPQFFIYNSRLKLSRVSTDGYLAKEQRASGFSFISPEVALLKCLGESAERFSLFCYKNKNLLDIPYKQEDFVNPYLYQKKKKKKPQLRWVKGYNLVKKKVSFIPAQLVYLNYIFGENGDRLVRSSTSTGAAAAFSKEEAILNGIYEVVERDALMNAYLNKITLPAIDLKQIGDKLIDYVLGECERYKLEIRVLDATNDLNIPSFISILIDRTGLGPPFVLGAKAGLISKKAIIGSMGEPFMVRGGTRRLLFDKETTDIEDTFASRARYWMPMKMINKMNFWINQRPTNHKVRVFKGSKKQELDRVVSMISKKGFEIFLADITTPSFKNLGYYGYKILIPGLQPLYLVENEKKYVLVKRLKQVSAYFGKKDFTVNTIPHPFL